MLALLDGGFYLAAESIVKLLTVTEFCSIFIVGKRPLYDLTTFAESALRVILYENSFIFGHITLSERDPRYAHYIDEQSQWKYQQPIAPHQSFNLEVLKRLTPLKLWQFYKTTVDLSKTQRESSKWLFDTYSRPAFGAKELALSFNPRYSIYAISHQDHSGSFQFSVHSHPGYVRNKQGQDLFYRSGEEYSKIRGGVATVHWSPNGEYLAVFDRFHKTIVTFFKFCPNNGTLRRIKNFSFSLSENIMLSNCHWLDSTSLFIPSSSSSSSILLKKISFLANNTYSVSELEHNFGDLRESKLGFFGAVPYTNLLFYVSPCTMPDHKHDHVYFSRLGQPAPISRLTLSGIVTSYCVDKNSMFFMTRSHKKFAFTPCPNFHFANLSESFDQCPFADTDYKLRASGYNYKTKLFKFIKVDCQTLAAEFLIAQLPLIDYKGDSAEGHAIKSDKERVRKCSKRNRLTSSKFYLCFNTDERTFFISKFCTAVFSSYHGNFKICHPSQPIFATSHSRLFRPTKLKFFLETRAAPKLKDALPKTAIALDYNKPLSFKLSKM